MGSRGGTAGGGGGGAPTVGESTLLDFNALDALSDEALAEISETGAATIFDNLSFPDPEGGWPSSGFFDTGQDAQNNFLEVGEELVDNGLRFQVDNMRATVGGGTVFGGGLERFNFEEWQGFANQSFAGIRLMDRFVQRNPFPNRSQTRRWASIMNEADDLFREALDINFNI